MKSTAEGHQQIDFLEKLIKVLYWVMVGCIAVGSLAAFIVVAVLIGGGIAAGVFFGLLFADALIAFLLYIAKCAWLIKIEYYDDVKYMRDYMARMSVVEYCIYSKTYSAYFVGIPQNDESRTYMYSKDKDKAMRFKTKTAALEYANAHKFDASNSDIITY